MDIVTIHSIWTLLLFIGFCGVVWWAYGSKSRQSRFDEAANSIFDEDEAADSSKEQGGMK